MTSPYDHYRLVLHELPVVRSLQELSDLTHLSPGLLYRLSQFPSKQYKLYHLGKKSGGTRLICQPSHEMKALQGWILRSILDRLRTSAACKGFEKGANIKENAWPHKGCSGLLCIDIADFFPSVRASWVYRIFLSAGYSPAIAALFTDICSFEGSLPQGAPTSPKLANLACWRLDRRLMGFVGRRGIMYTRYADDMAFSALSYRKLLKARGTIESIVKSEGFSLNEAKARFMGPSRARIVTGLVVHDAGVGIGRVKYRQLRAQIHSLVRCQQSEADLSNVAELSGWLAYTRGVDAERARMLENYVTNLRERYPESAISLL